MRLEIDPISYHESLREVIATDFKSLGEELPIKGGWGYSIDDAIIIDKNDPVVDPVLLFDGVGLEYIIVEKRLYEELIIFKKEGEKYRNIKWNLLRKNTIHRDGKVYDHLIFNVTCVLDKGDLDFVERCLNNGKFPDQMDSRELEELFGEEYFEGETEYYFDITSFYGVW